MSIEAIAWALHQPIKGSGEKGVLLGLCNHADDHGRCWPSLAKLALYSGCDERTVRRHLRTLEEMGLLHTEQREGRASVYIVDLTWTPDKMTGVPRTECPDTPDKMTPESLKEPFKEESPPMRAPAREGERLHPTTGRKLAVMPCPLPADWQPSSTDHRYMREKCPELEATFDVEVRKFRRYFHRNAHRVSANWSDLFEEWLDRAVTNFRRVNPVPFASLGQAIGAKAGATQSRPAARAAAGPDLDERLAEQDKRVLAELLKRQAAVGSGPVVDVRPPPRKNGAG